jgi:hypothetical protein
MTKSACVVYRFRTECDVTRALLILSILYCVGCDLALTAEEAAEALEESRVASQALTLSTSSTTISKTEGSDTIEIETEFTIGEAVKDRLEKIRDFIRSQVDCAEFEIDDEGTLTVEYGAVEGEDCEYLGQTYSGSHSITVEKVAEDQVIVHHEWDAFSNQKVTVSGEADVTWDKSAKSRRVEHELKWQAKGGRSERGGVGSGDRTQTVLDGGLLEGIEVDGEREWEGKSGSWYLEIDDIEMRWIDPVPQDGTWRLITPFNDKELTLDFERKDEDTIEVTAQTGRRTYTFNVTAVGQITRSD